MRKLFDVVAILTLTAALLTALGGCSVNVVVAPGATLAVESDLGQSAYQFVEGDGFREILREPNTTKGQPDVVWMRLHEGT